MFSIFPQESVYGKRDGSISGLAIISREARNMFKNTKGFKTGTVLNVEMLQRSAMFKPEQVGNPFINPRMIFPRMPQETFSSDMVWWSDVLRNCQ